MNKKQENTFKDINKIIKDKDIIIHTDIKYIVLLFDDLIKKNRKDLLDTLSKFLIKNLYAKSIFIPTFNYNFLKTRLYNIEKDIGEVGLFSEFCSIKYAKYRTKVPVFNHVDIKKIHQPNKYKYSLSSAFGKNSFYDWFTENGGFILFWGCDLSKKNTYIHHLEKLSEVSYRFDKIFKGEIITSLNKEIVDFEYYVRPIDLEIEYDDYEKLLIELKRITEQSL